MIDCFNIPYLPAYHVARSDTSKFT